MSDKKLVEEFQDICEIYIDIFLDKQDFEDFIWYGEVGGVVKINKELYISFLDIKHDIDFEIEKGDIMEWYNKTKETNEFITYRDYTRGVAFSK